MPPHAVLIGAVSHTSSTIDATATIDAAVSLNGVLTLTAPGAVHLDCILAAIVAGTYSSRSITAIRVGTLNGG